MASSVSTPGGVVANTTVRLPSAAMASHSIGLLLVIARCQASLVLYCKVSLCRCFSSLSPMRISANASLIVSSDSEIAGHLLLVAVFQLRDVQVREQGIHFGIGQTAAFDTRGCAQRFAPWR